MDQNEEEMKQPTSNNDNAGAAPRVFTWLIELFWIRFALWGRYWSRTMPLTLTDGINLTVWPRWGALLPPLALLVGLVFGWFSLGYQQVFSESIYFLMVVVLLGIFSAQLGLMFLFGFICGEFILALDWTTTPGWGRDGVYENVVLYRIPLLISYGLLAVLLVKIPVLTKQLLVQIRPPQKFSNQAKILFNMTGHVLLTGFMVYFWLQIMPVLIRPVFTWLSRSPTVEAIETFQVYGWYLVLLAVITSVARMYLQSRTVFRPALSRKLDAIEEKFEHKLDEKPDVISVSERIHPWLRAIVVTLMLTLVLSGLYESFMDALILGAFILVLQAARARLIPVPLGKWPQWVERVPLLYRLIAGFAIIFYLSRVVLDAYYSSFQYSFRPMIVLTGIAMLLIFLLNPGPGKRTEKSTEKSTGKSAGEDPPVPPPPANWSADQVQPPHEQTSEGPADDPLQQRKGDTTA